jgi:UrcA family protein
MHRFVFAAVATAVLIASPAMAEDRVAVRMHVHLKGVDLTTQKGAEVALARINSAARTSCTIYDTSRRTRTIDEVCVREMTARAVASLNSPQVLALLQSKQAAANS